MKFENLSLNTQILEVLNNMGFEYATEIQTKAIPEILNGKDVVARSETGSGKTFAFALPIIQNVVTSNDLQSLVVCPTRELAMQVADQFAKLTENIASIRTCAVFGGSNLDRQVKSLKKNPHILVGTPGRLIDLLKRKALKLDKLKFLVLDEADEMLDMGFRDDIEKIIEKCNADRQTVLFSATMPQEIKDLASKYQKNPVEIAVGTENKAIDKISQKYMFVMQKNKQEAIKELFMTDVFGKTILFVNTKRYAEELESFLNKNNIDCKAIHGDLRQSERKKVLSGFKDEKFDILIATDVAARGLDIKDVKYVVNFDLPQQLEYYVHRIGRTARAGNKGEVINIVANLSQLSYMREIEKQTKAKIELYQTNNEVLQSYFVDTKKLAQSTSRFGAKSKRQMLSEEVQRKKSMRFGGGNLWAYWDEEDTDNKQKNYRQKSNLKSKKNSRTKNNANTKFSNKTDSHIQKSRHSKNENKNYKKSKFENINLHESKSQKCNSKSKDKANKKFDIKNKKDDKSKANKKIVKSKQSNKTKNLKSNSNTSKKWFDKFTK